jgi:hypothetical protein
MLFSCRCLCPVSCLVLLSACGDMKTGEPPGKYVSNVNGLTMKVYGFGEHATHRYADDDILVTNGSSRLNIKNGRIVANGKDCGPVKKGDIVVLGADGRVTVNNLPRPPSD